MSDCPPTREPWLVWSFEHNAWWRANACGYSPRFVDAGLYSEADAKEIERKANPRANSRPGVMVYEQAMSLRSAVEFERSASARPTAGSVLELFVGLLEDRERLAALPDIMRRRGLRVFGNGCVELREPYAGSVQHSRVRTFATFVEAIDAARTASLPEDSGT